MANLFIAAAHAAALMLRLLCLVVAFSSVLAVAQEATPADETPRARPHKVFDHASTGFDLMGAHSFVPCQDCHIEGQFQGTPRNCVGCHQLNGRINALPKPIDHIQSSDQCEMCHNPTLWQDVMQVDHTQVFGNCAQCHNNVTAPGKPPTHPPTPNNQCQDCHSEIAFAPAYFSHEGIVDNCQSCHNGITATGRGPNHIPLQQEICADCHNPMNTLTWRPVARVDHSLVLGLNACVSCHNNVTATGKPVDHISTTNDCNACHDVYKWQDPPVDHSQVFGTCSSCHNGIIAPGQEQNPNHPMTFGLECDACHISTTTWTERR